MYFINTHVVRSNYKLCKLKKKKVIYYLKSNNQITISKEIHN